VERRRELGPSRLSACWNDPPTNAGPVTLVEKVQHQVGDDLKSADRDGGGEVAREDVAEQHGVKARYHPPSSGFGCRPPVTVSVNLQTKEEVQENSESRTTAGRPKVHRVMGWMPRYVSKKMLATPSSWRPSTAVCWGGRSPHATVSSGFRFAIRLGAWASTSKPRRGTNLRRGPRDRTASTRCFTSRLRLTT